MKTCTSCTKELDISCFYVRKASKDGLSRLCRVCDNQAKKQWREANKEKYQATNKEYHAKNKDKFNSRTAEWRRENRGAFLESMRRWRKKNKHRQAQHAMKYVASKLNATPTWLTKDQLERMDETYLEMTTLNKEHGKNSFHVDHIVPLKGKTVCGLHVPWNLEVKTRHENISKGNRAYPDSWNNPCTTLNSQSKGDNTTE